MMTMTIFLLLILSIGIHNYICDAFITHQSTCNRKSTNNIIWQPIHMTDQGKEEIFFDDFSGVSIGEIANSDTPSTPKIDSELPDFDFDEYDDKQEEKELISIPLPKAVTTTQDLTGCTLREFSFGPDIMLSSYVGSLGFDKVTDWQYYETDAYSGERKQVSPRPMDPTQPSRTKSSSGSVVRLFLGEIGGKLGGKLRSRGLDCRVWIKEYSGEEALELARSEKMGIGRIQTAWLKQYLQRSNNNDLLESMEDGEWIDLAQRRYVDGLTDTPSNKDDENIITLMELLLSQKAKFTSLLGELNLSDYWDDENIDANEWYKSLGVKPADRRMFGLAQSKITISTVAPDPSAFTKEFHP